LLDQRHLVRQCTSFGLLHLARARLSDVPTAGAILDRFLHHAQVIAITGKSYRVKEAPGISHLKKQRKSNEPSTAGGAS